ncbi:hypothetical protein [Mesorhizobium sp. A623]
MPKRSAVMSQIRNSRVTLKRVTTNQPEKIATDRAAQPKPMIRERSNHCREAGIADVGAAAMAGSLAMA